MFRNKIGATGNQIMIFQYLFILTLISVGFFIGISIFFGQGYDFRQTQSDLLNYKISECIIQNENIDFSNFFSICGLNKDLLQKNDLNFKICDAMEFSDCVSATNSIVSVGSNFEACLLKGAKSNDKYPKCSFKEIQMSDKKYVLITKVNQAVREIK